MCVYVCISDVYTVEYVLVIHLYVNLHLHI